MTYPEAIEVLDTMDKHGIDLCATNGEFRDISDLIKSMANALAEEGGASQPYPGINVEWL